MKKILATFMWLLTVGTAAADNYDYLTLRLSDGTEQSLSVSGLVLKFENNALVATSSSTETVTVALSNMAAMFFSNEEAATSISDVSTGGIDISLSGRQLMVSAPSGSQVIVSNLAGVVVARHTSAGNGRESVGRVLTPGIYAVKVNNITKKIKVL